MEDIDDYKNQIHEEFDEIQYLIKFADKTHKLIGRHKNVISNIFKGAGLKPKRNYDEYEEDNENLNDKNEVKVKKKKKDSFDDYDNYNEYDDEPRYVNGYYYRNARRDDEDLNEVFDKMKKINKIKDNLSNIQDDFLGYHSNLKHKIKEMHS